MTSDQQILDLFVDQGLVQRSQIEDILSEINNSGKTLQQVMVDFEIAEPEQYYRTIADSIGADYVDLGDYEVPPEVQRLIPGGTARLNGALPIGQSGESIVTALLDPLDSQVVDDLRFTLGRDIQIVVAPAYQVQERITKYYGADMANMDDVLKELSSVGGIEYGDGGPGTGDLTNEANAAPIIRFVDLILYQAIQDRASDIHFEPFEYEFKIRYRVDGVLYQMAPPPRHLALPVISRVKVMANLNIAERRLPQYGESVVLRVLDRSSVNLDLETLGMPPNIYSYLLATIEKPNGIFIVTGPTGSGKTTTLYACLRKINNVETKLLTAEDPVEYDIEGLIQVPINEGIGLTFGRVLRAFLRQDPDRIMVGETRDLETAQIAIQASLTGHLVFSTLHTNDAAGAVTRLVDMGVEPFLISSSLEGILAQRLIRRICTSCRTAYEPKEELLMQMGLSPHEIGDKSFYYGTGCDACNHTGYKGRKGIYELLEITDPIRELVNQRAPSLVIKQRAVELGMVTLREDGLRSIYDGDTTIEEVLKYT